MAKDGNDKSKHLSTGEVQGLRMLAGGMGGIVAKTAVAPLDRVRILAQTGASDLGMVGTIGLVVKEDGIGGLWRGNTVNCIRVFPNKALLYMFSDAYKEALRKYTVLGTFPVLSSFLGGGFAGMTSNFLTYPLDTIRAHQAGMVRSPGFFALIRDIMANDGVGGFYRGLKPSMIGAIPYEGLKFGFFAFFKNRRPDFIEPGVTWNLVSGALAGALGSTIMYPNDTVRRILQVQGVEKMKPGSLGHGRTPKKPYTGMVEAYTETFRQYGMKRFYRGLGANLIRIAPNTSIQFAVYEKGKLLIEGYAAGGDSVKSGPPL